MSSYLLYLDANNLHRWGTSQTFPVNGFKQIKKLSKFDDNFIKNHDENSNKGYIIEVDVEYRKRVLDLLGNLPFLAEKKKIKKYNKLVCDIHDKENYVVHIRVLNQALNHRLIF